jgi:hypothetical protein
VDGKQTKRTLIFVSALSSSIYPLSGIDAPRWAKPADLDEKLLIKRAGETLDPAAG